MKIKSASTIAIACLLVGFGTSSAQGKCASCTNCTMTAKSTTNDVVKAEVKLQTICPVMGGEVNKKLFVDAEGKRIYVCCKGCIAPVKKDPKQYIAKLEAEGVTLEKTPVAAPAEKPEAK